MLTRPAGIWGCLNMTRPFLQHSDGLVDGWADVQPVLESRGASGQHKIKLANVECEPWLRAMLRWGTASRVYVLQIRELSSDE